MKLIILDRDGVINFDSKHFLTSPEQWKPLPGSLEAIARLAQSGYKITIATNQSGVGRGLFGMATLNAIHSHMIRAITEAGGRVDAVFYCPHAADVGCDCRKPSPGMLRAISERFQIELDEVPFVGDSLRDVQAAHASGAKPVLVRTGKGAMTERDGGLPPNTRVYADLATFVLETVQ